MITLLARLFIKDRDKVADAAVRRAYGMLCSLTGIGLNVLLFLGKYLAGRLSGSIAMTADAFNNLSDAGSSAITLLGFRMAAKKPDPGHPSVMAGSNTSPVWLCPSSSSLWACSWAWNLSTRS